MREKESLAGLLWMEKMEVWMQDFGPRVLSLAWQVTGRSCQGWARKTQEKDKMI
jgi:hypothetical protein